MNINICFFIFKFYIKSSILNKITNIEKMKVYILKNKKYILVFKNLFLKIYDDDKQIIILQISLILPASFLNYKKKNDSN